MKAALLLEQDINLRDRTAYALRWLGYAVAPVRTAQEALSAVLMLKFDLIVTSTVVKPDDRRSLTGELKRSAPATPVVLITNDKSQPRDQSLKNCAGVSAIVKRPASLDALRRAIEYQLDHELLPARLPMDEERRRSLPHCRPSTPIQPVSSGKF